MKVTYTNNYNFKGKFRNNTLLERTLANADNYALNLFLKTLKNMERIKDGQEFYLKVISSPICGMDFVALESNKGPFIKGVCVSIFDGFKNLETQYRSNNILKRTTHLLNNIYSPPLEEIPPKEELLKAIHSKLDKNM